MRFKLLPREAATYVKLRSLGYSINCIARAFGRSTSLVHRILKFNLAIRNLVKMDLRKLPTQVKMFSSRTRWEILQKFLPLWESWALGEGGKPP